MVAARPVSGQDQTDADAEPHPAPSRAVDPIDLAARRVRVWSKAGDRWVEAGPARGSLAELVDEATAPILRGYTAE